MLKKVNPKQDFVKLEHEVLKFWEDKQIFKKYQTRNADSNKHWSFQDGPITANNPMGVHHAWGRTLKDVFQRFKNMQGYQERFQNTFDCQGLWVEVEVEKELGFKNKKDIEKYGVGKFVNKCKERVNKYAKIQTEQSIRLGQFMDWDESYYTMSEENNYAIWHFLKKCHERGYLYKGRDSVPWCARCGTAISQHEILTEEYKELVHTAVYFRLPLQSKEFANTSLLVWTTTPWTIPANVAVAMSPDFEYGLYQHRETKEQIIFLKDLEDKVLKKDKANFKLIKTYKGKELVGQKYAGAFDDLERVKKATQKNPDTFHTVILAEDLVTDEEGTGMVHIAPGCGKEDFDLSKEEKLLVIDVIDEGANYNAGMGELSGKNAKQDPKLIFQVLKEKEDGKYLYKLEDYKHRYPTCWRCKEELVWRVVDEWYIAMDVKVAELGNKSLREMMIEVAKKINWKPSFGLDQELDWLNNMHDWLISKKRYWGLALPIYECKCGNFEVIGSREELKERAVEGWQEFDGNTPHKPWIDEVKIKCSKCEEILTRIPDVGNPWLDAGILPFSSLGYFRDKVTDVDGQEKTGKEYWQKWFPADLILECFPGQFKNWFYALIAMSTVIENTNPFETVLGHSAVRDEKGEEMHKSKGNAIWFDEAAEKMGVDTMRFMYSAANPFKNLNFGYQPADDYRRKVILLWNVYSFFVTYASIDKFDPSKGKIDFGKLDNKLDQYIISLLHETIEKFTDRLEKHDTFGAMGYAEQFLESLANWYIRRSRRRFWKSENDDDKDQAYHVLYEVLTSYMKMLAPVMPFVSENMYQNLVRSFDDSAPESIHLTDYPVADKKLIDAGLNDQMRLLLRVVSLGHAARDKGKIKVRQPLDLVTVIGGAELDKDLQELLADELNVKKITFVGKTGSGANIKKYATQQVKLNFPILGKKYGSKVKEIQVALNDNWKIVGDELIIGEHKLSADEYELAYEPKEGYSVESDRELVVVLDMKITPELRQEGIARDIVRYIQDLRKEANYNVDDRIIVECEAKDGKDELAVLLKNHSNYINKETLSDKFEIVEKFDESSFDASRKIELGGQELQLGVKK
ncbi:MAG: isoleucine--tRNA ligase [Parcubacteria group bacterium]|nr:isoleucine--tRNA ligase [Parcubacteria group bacterium]